MLDSDILDNMQTLELCLFEGEGITIRGEPSDHINGIWSVYDFINTLCGKDHTDAYARVTYSRFTKPGEPHAAELKSREKSLKVLGRGQRETPAMDLNGLLYLLGLLEGKVATQYRKSAQEALSRVLAGDKTLIRVIEANALSTAPMQQAFRAALEPTNTLEQLSGIKRKRVDLVEDTNHLVNMKEKIDWCIWALQRGVISEYEHNAFARQALFQHFPAIDATNAPIPLIDPFFIFWSAIINWLSTEITTKKLGLDRPMIRVGLSFSDIEDAYSSFFAPYVGYLTTTTEKQLIIDTSLMPNPEHKPHEVRLQQLMMVQKKREMTIYSHRDLHKKAEELFRGYINMNPSKRSEGYTFHLMPLKGHLSSNMPYEATGYDESVSLSKPIKFRVI